MCDACERLKGDGKVRDKCRAVEYGNGDGQNIEAVLKVTHRQAKRATLSGGGQGTGGVDEKFSKSANFKGFVWKVNNAVWCDWVRLAIDWLHLRGGTKLVAEQINKRVRVSDTSAL